MTGLVSGLHAPEASHLLLEAVAGWRLVRAAYEQAATPPTSCDTRQVLPHPD